MVKSLFLIYLNYLFFPLDNFSSPDSVNGWSNKSVVTEFILLGLSSSWRLQVFLFFIFSVFYGAAVLGNILIIITVIIDSHLHSPMYFLLSNLSFIDVCQATFATPKMIADFLNEHKTITFQGCMSQIFFLHVFGGSEMVLLVAMTYDRYIAICKPLHYMTIMNRGCALFWWGFPGPLASHTQPATWHSQSICLSVDPTQFFLWPPPSDQACLLRHLCFWDPGAHQQWSALTYVFPPFARFLHYHPCYCASPSLWWDVQGPFHSVCPHYCCASILWPINIHLYLALWKFPSWQIYLCVFYCLHSSP